jgi:hypothetical protein
MSRKNAREAAPAAPPRVVFASGATIETAMLPFRILGLRAAFGLRVTVALSPEALGFVSVPVLEAVTASPVYRENTQTDAATGLPMHKPLAGSDLLVLYPASARILAQCALGEVTDTVTRLFSFTPKKNVVVAPSIHPEMEKSLYTGHAETLKRIGCRVLAPGDLWASWRDVEDAVVEKLGLSRLKPSPRDVMLDKILG